MALTTTTGRLQSFNYPVTESGTAPTSTVRAAKIYFEDGSGGHKDLPSYIVDTGTGLNWATRTGCSYCEYGVDR
jgi:hypothetical protein